MRTRSGVFQHKIIGVMSLPHSICLTILVVCNYVCLGKSELDKKSNAQHDDVEFLSSDADDDHSYTAALFSWPQGIVPYYIDPESYDQIISNRIRSAMNMIESVSCVVFSQIPEKPDSLYLGYTYLHIVNRDKVRDCSHDVFRSGGDRAILILGYDCMQRRDILHALLHVLGFRDEVTHPHRDMYVRIIWQNIQTKYRPLFRLQTDDLPHRKLVEYDTMSIMHFHDRAYSMNGGATIAPLISGLLINPSERLSQLDIMKLRMAFGHECNKRKVGNLFETCQNALHSDYDDESETGERSKECNHEAKGSPVERTKNGTKNIKGKT